MAYLRGVWVAPSSASASGALPNPESTEQRSVTANCCDCSRFSSSPWVPQLQLKLRKRNDILMSVMKYTVIIGLGSISIYEMEIYSGELICCPRSPSGESICGINMFAWLLHFLLLLSSSVDGHPFMTSLLSSNPHLRRQIPLQLR